MATATQQTAAQQLAEFSRFCADLRVEDGAPFKLYPFQRKIVAPYFAGVRETAILIPKGNGKSTLIAALALYHLLATSNAECLIAAASRDQAEVILRQSHMFIRNSPSLSRLVTILQRSITSSLDGGRIRVLAADADTADGVIPTLAIVDELHRHKKIDLYGVLRDGLNKRQGQLITISTAGATMASPLGVIRTRAHDMPSFRRVGMHNTATSGSRFAFHEWCLGERDDPTDMTLVKKANPAPWYTVQTLRDWHDSESMTPWQWLRFACGVWTEGEEPWLEPARWDARAGKVSISEDAKLIVGVDVEARKGDAALVLIQRTDEGFICTARISEDRTLGEIEDELRELKSRYALEHVVYMDRSFERSADILESEGLPIVMVPDSPKRKEQVAATLFKVIDEGRLTHDGDAEFRAQVLAGRVKESESGWRFVRDPNLPRPINALVALAGAIHIAETQTLEAPVVMIEWV